MVTWSTILLKDSYLFKIAKKKTKNKKQKKTKKKNKKEEEEEEEVKLTMVRRKNCIISRYCVSSFIQPNS